MPKAKWHPILMLASLAGSALLYYSWFEWELTRSWWDALDTRLFIAANESLRENRAWMVTWAIANNRTFDVVPALMFIGLFFSYMRDGRHGAASTVIERGCACLLAALVVLLVTQLDRQFIHVGRPSPTMVLESAFLMSQHIDWITTKDSSGNSFPSDHGTVAILFTLFLWHFAGWRYALYGFIAIAFSVMPRMVGGAHWFTDVAVGSLMLCLPAAALTFTTPYFTTLATLMARVVRRFLPWVEPTFLALTDKERLYLAVKGACIGVADIVPGMSGGSMAFILGIYQQLLHAITRVNKSWFGKIMRIDLRGAVSDIPLLFLLPLAAGIVIAVIIFTRLIPIPYLLTAYPEPVYGLFFGLIVGSVLLLYIRHARARVSDVLLLIAGCAAGYLLVSQIPSDTPDEPWFIFLCGVIAVSAMLLPGLSGSFVLLVLGKYALILQALGEFDMTLLLPFISGCVIGLLCFSHALYWLLQRYYVMSVMVMVGIMAGSLHSIWPFQERVFEEIRGRDRLVAASPQWPAEDSPLVITLAMMAVGLAAALLAQYFAFRKRQGTV